MNLSAIRHFVFVVALMTPAALVLAQPGAPASLTATGAEASVDLNWSAVPGATGYRISRGTASGTYGYFVNLGAVTSYSDTAVTNATQYFYVVAARSALGIGANSAPTRAAPGTYTGAPFLIAPAHESRPALGMSFEWSDPAVYSSYSFVLVDTDRPGGLFRLTERDQRPLRLRYDMRSQPWDGGLSTRLRAQHT